MHEADALSGPTFTSPKGNHDAVPGVRELIDPNGRFCQWCGTPVDENVVQLATSSERRYATVLFADIANSTVMVRDREPEFALERLSPILETMKRTIAEFGGIICRDQGDGIMALFGAPTSDDRHAANACRAGMTLIERTVATGPFQTACRVGIHSGMVVGHMISTSWGRASRYRERVVHLAARLHRQPMSVQF